MTDRPVLLVGSPRDAHIAEVAKRLTEDGVDVVVVDTIDFPERPAISLGERLDDITIDGRSLGTPASVYVRDLYVHPLAVGVDIADEMELDWYRTLVAFREKANLLLGMLARWSELGVPVYNPMSPDWRLTKTLQLAPLERAGLPVPETIWTNDPARVPDFAEGRRVAYKPVAGGAATKELSAADLTTERLQSLRGAPVTFQELIEGDNFRVFCIDGQIITCFRITSESLDYRQTDEVIEETTLPEQVLSQCLKAADLLGLRWAGIDLRRDGAGVYRFLELNASPMFLGFDARADGKILSALVGRLSAHALEG